MLTALRAAVAHYRIATTAESESEVETSADHAQACAAIAGVGAASVAVALVFALIAVRCFGEAAGAAMASGVPGLSEWVRADALERGWSALGYAISWCAGAWFIGSSGSVVVNAMWASLRNEPETPRKWWMPWK